MKSSHIEDKKTDTTAKFDPYASHNVNTAKFYLARCQRWQEKELMTNWSVVSSSFQIFPNPGLFQIVPVCFHCCSFN